MSLQKLHGIEASRGIAALLVVLMHTASLFSPARYFGHLAMGGLWTFGHAGVDFFFVLSGFIIYYVHAGDIGHSERLKSYWRKRFIRVYPTYWIVLAGYGLLLYLSPSKDLYEQSLQAAFTSALLIPQQHAPILSVAWSLCHEILFYIVFSALFLNRTAGRMLFGIWLTGILLNVFFLSPSDATGTRFLFSQFNLEFFFGIACAYLLKHRNMGMAQSSLGVGMLGFFGTGLIESLVFGRQYNDVAFHLSYALFSALTIYGLAGLERAGKLQTGKPLRLLGQSSYSIYLIHVVVVMCFQQIYLRYLYAFGLPETLIFLACVSAAVAAGVAFSQLIEVPLLRWLRSRHKSARALASETA